MGYSSRKVAGVTGSRCEPGQCGQIDNAPSELQTPRKAVDATGLSRGDAGGESGGVGGSFSDNPAGNASHTRGSLRVC